MCLLCPGGVFKEEGGGEETEGPRRMRMERTGGRMNATETEEERMREERRRRGKRRTEWNDSQKGRKRGGRRIVS